MRVTCIGTRLPKGVLALEGYGSEEPWHGIVEGRSYIVYGMLQTTGRCLAFDVDPEMTPAVPSHLFRLVDGRMSRFWIFGQEYWERYGNQSDVMFSLWGYPEYVATTGSHLLGLRERRPEDVSLFRKYREAMDLEFPDPNVKAAAVLLEERWIQCPSCCDAWESVSRDGMVRCPTCAAFVHNPLYEERRLLLE